ncbi:MAG: hypothetical protein Q9N32_07080 [Gammaproteobacteria bacterium]|nr:hypothetical protein [Gammaproteobacteria bacterium]
MPIEFKKTVAVCSDICTIEEAETLLGWLLDNPKGKINLKSCEQLHTSDCTSIDGNSCRYFSATR